MDKCIEVLGNHFCIKWLPNTNILYTHTHTHTYESLTKAASSFVLLIILSPGHSAPALGTYVGIQ